VTQWNGLVHVLTLRCEAASELSSRELDEPLTRLDRAALWCHLLACRSCRRFRRQLWLIRRAVRRDRTLGAGADGDEGLSPEARTRMARAIRRAIGEQADAEGASDESA
jgi:hypothetical protein